MKNPEQYAAEAIASTPAEYGTLPVIIAAVEAALADSAKYKDLLLKAIRNSTSPTPQSCTPSTSI